MNKGTPFLISLLGLASTLSGSIVKQQAKKSAHPFKDFKNVLLIQTDHELFYQHGTEHDFFQIQRPNLDRFFAQGVQFTNAKSITPLCSPCRRTILTGTYPHNAGVITNRTDDQEYAYPETIYDILLENDFGKNNIYFYGKTHYGGDLMDIDTPTNTYGVKGWASTGYGQPYTTTVYRNYLERNNYFGTPQYSGPEMILSADSLNSNGTPAKGEVFKLANMGFISGNNFGISYTPKEYHESYFLADLAKTDLTKIAQKGSDDPFFMTVNIWGPHHPAYPTQEFVDLYTDEHGVIGGNIPEYPNFKDEFINKAIINTYDQQNTSQFNFYQDKTWEDFRIYMALTYAQTTLVDEAIGTILDHLDSVGLAEDTLVIISNDHGDALGTHGGHADKESYMSEETMAIIMGVRDPDQPSLANVKSDAYVNNADIPATVLANFDLSFRNPRASTVDMVALMKGEQTPRQYIVSETNGHHNESHARCVYYQNYKYIYYVNDIDEFYDLSNDPYELNNLIYENSLQGVQTLMKAMILDWQIATNDIVSYINL